MRHVELEADVMPSSAVTVNAVIIVLAALCAIMAIVLLVKFDAHAANVAEAAYYLFGAAAVLGGVAWWHARRQRRRLSLHREAGVHTLEVAGRIMEEGPFELRFGYADFRPAGRRGARTRRLVLCVDKDGRTVCTLMEGGNPVHSAPRGWPEGWPESDGGPVFHIAGGRPILEELRRRLDSGAVDEEGAIADGPITEGAVAALVKMFGGNDKAG